MHIFIRTRYVKMKLEKELENLIIDNAIGHVDDEYLVNYILANPSLIPPSEDKDIEQQVKWLFSNKDTEVKNKARTIDFIFGTHIDLAKYEKRRLQQIQSSSKSFLQLKKIISAHGWLSGGYSINYIDHDEIKHTIFLEYPLRKHRVKLKSLMGALYIDRLLVPVRSTLEYAIINLLKCNNCEDGEDDAVNIIIDFVSSTSYIENARKLGRIT